MRIKTFIAFLLIHFFFIATTQAQTTTFSYQGKLTDTGTAANGSYQMQFKLFDALAGGNQIGVTISDVAVTANQGIFSVKLDFGAAVFTGADRFLEIAVRRNSGETYTTLAPREQIVSSPYKVRTLSAAGADTATNATNATTARPTNPSTVKDLNSPPNSRSLTSDSLGRKSRDA
jgi:hypothetical protein